MVQFFVPDQYVPLFYVKKVNTKYAIFQNTLKYVGQQRVAASIVMININITDKTNTHFIVHRFFTSNVLSLRY